MLSETIPANAAIAMFVNPNNPNSRSRTAFIRDQQELWKPAIKRIADEMK